MMTARPTGHYVLKDDGLYLQFDRLFHAPIEDVWFSLTNPNAMRAWIGTYTGSPATGGVRFRMETEGEGEWQNVSILECAPPHRFVADSGSGPTGIRLFCHLLEGGGMTTLTLGQRLHDPSEAADMGPGWDFYLDRLAAARAGTPQPAWETYYPAFAPHYRELHVPDEARSHP
ncbi:SRPBCC family protein [Agromyces laixinhei]|uniref:SRPBCC family protein n=2 Tax=Agromyces laixinhei TaxID=2585717 RepID=UPI0011160CDE|nr:SRPBCC family protein [Agromyces laixinhei]